MSREPSREQLVDDATRWWVLMNSGQASEAERRAYQRWRNADPQHEQLCRQLETRLGVFQVPIAQGVDGELLQRALNAPSSRRKVLQRALLGAGVALGAGALVSQRGLPLAELTADLHTGTGQRQSLTLPDGSELRLNARSAANIDFDRQRRVVHLLDGEVLLNLASDPSRPFFIHTAQTRIQATGSRLLVRERDGQGQATALNGPLDIAGRSGERLQLPGGHEVAYDAFHFGPVRPSRGSATAWVDGLLELRDTPLSEVVEALRPYRRGVLRLDPAIAGLRVSGLFRLDNPQQILDSLARTLPIRVTRHTELWVTLSAA
ncbi:Fe2+-dicitrate sensor, membrane component [Pseudomonas chlororaphis subsp. aurantiaca]|uniref:FecR domain-containing protein n=1 Tax=Pseudomonas chlororaphis TaxID=587753 RepID=UPI000F58C8B1|nr:FecR domain-containing protein [Pseudomonas chlororaphis]AZD23928.1 Fe2+-dicitrate sensor, membrane component [Pseudomonas chlororaphis subsp. aurantiaca]AZD37591.1 Fe2+-dicitrate sensor, membrane component [Pseudomonas chlororaphis subsp. aurantiaca]AZD43930.1 Fe2+-dicitrate sensor, membrane component [Pseudomonas chlororaphis subsp. aurantiaca]AZD56488.1 Fe2+-dicitrate sensor, membrane component [Pseudomonas chlororaphis subsp. aurantiaca]AZD62484.1 Fe2+-dicitrate sensor, membrane compone